MKNKGICPKCQSEEILIFENKEKSSKYLPDSEVIGAFGKRIYTSRYVCCNCGFTERYFEDEDLNKLKKKYKKIKG